MRIEVTLELDVDPAANFIEVEDEDTLDVLMDMIKMVIYDIDDVSLDTINLEKL